MTSDLVPDDLVLGGGTKSPGLPKTSSFLYIILVLPLLH